MFLCILIKYVFFKSERGRREDEIRVDIIVLGYITSKKIRQ